MWAFDALCDQFYVASRLFLKLELNPSRESLLHFCEQLRRAYPELTRFRLRENGAVVLDEPHRDGGGRRYIRIDQTALRFGHFSPPDHEALADFGRLVLTNAPCHLSLSDLDYDALEVLFGFDLEYSGNHDELVAEALFGDSALLAVFDGDAGQILECQPCIGVRLSDDCSTQAFVDVRARTTKNELRSGEFEEQSLSVYLTMRREFRRGTSAELADLHAELLETGEDLAVRRVVPNIVRRLQEAIASRR